MIDNFKEIKLETPVDKIIRQIRELITSGQLNPGDKLPSERMLAKQFAIGRSYVRDAIQKLEFYGILKTLPQSGTVVAGLGIAALEGLITDILKIDQSDFKSLVDTRILLEKESARLAALNRTADDLVGLTNALVLFEKKLELGENAIEEDLMFHVRIAEASQNSVLKSLMLIITPDIVSNFYKYDVCDEEKLTKTKEEHRRIYECIVAQDEQGVLEAMDIHLRELHDFSLKYVQKK